MMNNHKQRHLEKKSQQLLSEDMLRGKTHKINCEDIKFHSAILFARPVNQNSIILLALDQTEEKSAVALDTIRHAVIIAILSEMNLFFSGEWIIEVMSMSQAATLFSFLDYQSKCPEARASFESIEGQDDVMLRTASHLVLRVEHENKSFMALVISSLLDLQDRRLESLFTFVRNVESYWIAHFLLSQVMNEDKEGETHKIYNASRIYGVSESYFRKLCHHAFTRGPKKQLRLWRAANSALQLIENNHSIATIADDNGYASSSHFSSEIKSLFGITPREFKKLEGLLHE
ncbi:helix-turn-helix domain-containing protein [Pantoea ananatis]|uniref:helix-turn-helix domain-containing protein n=1 Tax=Pantoea ananas TaxID=553 RepID=UPI00158E3AEF|nr:helix-turn-helix domain-containing protein [Pantoea ananatis]MBA4823741.1 helix-turn-helix domain-containing protein [Pantoea ananatis]QKV85984.1 helix-turn-helix domain-containing protein [Pantoea ananatis]